MSNSYQRAKARVKELEAENEVLQSKIDSQKQAIILQDHFAALTGKDIHSKNQIIQAQKNVIKVIVGITIILTAGIVALSSIM